MRLEPPPNFAFNFNLRRYTQAFDSGQWVDKKLSSLFQSRKVCCRKTVFVLTTNILLQGKTLVAQKKELQSHFPKVER
jgi:hypothetical protein